MQFLAMVNALIPTPTPGESGLLLAQVLRHQPFLGYRGARELSERKLVRDVRRKGDVYFNTGDVLAMDEEGFLYFRDRLGDTFRSGPGRVAGASWTFEGGGLKKWDFQAQGAWLLDPEIGQNQRSDLIGGGAWWARGASP